MSDDVFSSDMNGLTLLLLVANFANKNDAKNCQND